MLNKKSLTISVHYSVNKHHISYDLPFILKLNIRTNVGSLSSVIQFNLNDLAKEEILLRIVQGHQVFRRSYRLKVTCHRQHQECFTITIWITSTSIVSF